MPHFPLGHHRPPDTCNDASDSHASSDRHHDPQAPRWRNMRRDDSTLDAGSNSDSAVYPLSVSPLLTSGETTAREKMEATAMKRRHAVPCTEAALKKMCDTIGTQETMMLLLREVRAQRMSTNYYKRKYRGVVEMMSAEKPSALKDQHSKEYFSCCSIKTDLNRESPSPSPHTYHHEKYDSDGGGEKSKVFSRERTWCISESPSEFSNALPPSTADTFESKLVLDALNDTAASTDQLRAALRHVYSRCQQLCGGSRDGVPEMHQVRSRGVTPHLFSDAAGASSEFHFAHSFTSETAAGITNINIIPPQETNFSSAAQPLPRSPTPSSYPPSPLLSRTLVPPAAASMNAETTRTASGGSVRVSVLSVPSSQLMKITTSRDDDTSGDRGGDGSGSHDGGSEGRKEKSGGGGGRGRSNCGDNSDDDSCKSSCSTRSAIQRLSDNEKLRQWRLAASRMRGEPSRYTFE